MNKEVWWWWSGCSSTAVKVLPCSISVFWLYLGYFSARSLAISRRDLGHFLQRLGLGDEDGLSVVAQTAGDPLEMEVPVALRVEGDCDGVEGGGEEGRWCAWRGEGDSVGVAWGGGRLLAPQLSTIRSKSARNASMRRYIVLSALVRISDRSIGCAMTFPYP